MVTKKRYRAAADPGVNTGFAIYDTLTKKFRLIETWTFCLVYEYLRDTKLKGQISSVTVEVPRTNHVWGDKARRYNVGRNNREAELLAEMIERLGYKVIRQHPLGKIKKVGNISAEKIFRKLTGWTGRTDKDNRDAAMLAMKAIY